MTDTEKFRFCVAPMLDWTDRHCRYFMRLMTKRARLYTEMVTAPAILFGNRDLLLKFDETEHPVACQLGGSDPEPLNGRSTLMEISGDIEVKTVPEKRSSWINNSIGLDIIG